MDFKLSLQLFYRDFIFTIKNYQKAIPFIKANQLWKGFMDYTWVSKFLLAIGIIVSLKFGGIYSDWFEKTSTQGMSLFAIEDLVSKTTAEGYDMFVSGGFKYVILILLEIVAFHFSRKTLEVLTGETAESSLKSFIAAQARMVKIVIFAYVMETLFSILAATLIAAMGMDWIKPVVIFLIQCFFLGFAIVDNYNEIFKMSVNQSFKYTRQYAGVSIGIGIVIYVLMLVPVLGAFLAPLLGAVTATITMHELNKKDHSLLAEY